MKRNGTDEGNKTEPQPLLMRPQQVAETCGVSVKVVRRWIDEDGLPIHELPGRGGRAIALVHRDDLDQWLRKFRVQPASSASSVPPTIRLDGRRYVTSVRPEPPNSGKRKKRA